MASGDFGRGIVIPLLQNVDGNRFTTDNYRVLSYALSYSG